MKVIGKQGKGKNFPLFVSYELGKQLFDSLLEVPK